MSAPAEVWVVWNERPTESHIEYTYIRRDNAEQSINVGLHEGTVVRYVREDEGDVLIDRQAARVALDYLQRGLVTHAMNLLAPVLRGGVS